GKRRIKGKVEIIIDKGTDSSEDRIHLNMREERMEQWQTALNRVIVCLVILFIEHEHILPKKAPHPLRIRCLFLFLDCQKFNSPFLMIRIILLHNTEVSEFFGPYCSVLIFSDIP
ncbi:hypothetical protein BM735_09535, partial [Erysipelotrichaceae bacterium NYU-BL-F16]